VKKTDKESISYGLLPDQTDQAIAGALTQASWVENLLEDVAWMEESMRKMMSFLQNSPLLNPHKSTSNSSTGNTTADQSHPQTQSSQAAPENVFQAPMGSKFSHIARLEPLKIQDLWFAGDLSQLGLFLRSVWGFLRPRLLLFQSELQRVVWISRDFGYRPSEHWKTPSPTENWYNSLLLDNSQQQGVYNQYADLDGIPFLLPTLLSVKDFLGGLIAIFGNKSQRRTQKRLWRLANSGTSP
jgi:hypothetical protein